MDMRPDESPLQDLAARLAREEQANKERANGRVGMRVLGELAQIAQIKLV